MALPTRWPVPRRLHIDGVSLALGRERDSRLRLFASAVGTVIDIEVVDHRAWIGIAMPGGIIVPAEVAAADAAVDAARRAQGARYDVSAVASWPGAPGVTATSYPVEAVWAAICATGAPARLDALIVLDPPPPLDFTGCGMSDFELRSALGEDA